MGTVKELLDIAKGELGVKESPKNSNIVKYNDWYWGKGKYGDWAAWCVAFVAWCCDKAEIKLPTRTASCTEMMNAAKKANMWVVRDFKPGDLVIFDWSGKQKTPAHIGIVESILPDYGVQTIEGNTSVSDNSNGGEVMRRNRAMKYIIGAVRPVFDKEPDKEDVFKMTIDEFISKLSDEQAYTLLSKAQRYAGEIAEPTWSKNEGHWERAKNKGLVDGERPEAFVKRDEFVAVMGRAGLL